MAGHLVHRLLRRGGEGLTDLGGEFGLGSKGGHAGGEGDLLLSEDLACSQIFPDHFESEVHLQLARVIVASLPEDALSHVDDATGQTGIAIFLHDTEGGSLLNLLLYRFGQLQVETTPIRRRFKHRNFDRPNLLIVRKTDDIAAASDRCRDRHKREHQQDAAKAIEHR